jgi:hypothetical protein
MEKIFSTLAVGFDKIPLLNKIKGYRSEIGIAGCLLVYILNSLGKVDDATALKLNGFIFTYTGAALNAKGRK